VGERRESAGYSVAAGVMTKVSTDQLVAEAVNAANEAIHSRAQRNLRLSGMGTTLVGLLVEDEQVLVLNVGDSRCYHLRDGRLRQVTLDHSLVEQQVRLGKMTAQEAARSPFRNVITRAMGTQAEVHADTFALDAKAGDMFLLCSDGLTRELDDSRIEALLTGTAPLDELCKRLIQAANKAGGNDNITCLLVRVQ